MTVGILGLGLIGGSMARAYRKAGHRVLASDTDKQMLSFAKLAGAVSGELTGENIPECDLILLCVYPEASAAWLEEHGAEINKTALVLDCCGVKTLICKRCFPVAERCGFTFVGGHPMAGSHFSGFKYSRSNLFQGAPMVLVPPVFDDIALLQRVKDALSPCGFGSFSVTTAEEHDKMIAFTSQMPHIVSNAYVKSPTAAGHQGFSAGSYKDLTRVAKLNETMWSELFLCNAEPLAAEIDEIIKHLDEYRRVIRAGDRETLTELLRDGRIRKESLG